MQDLIFSSEQFILVEGVVLWNGDDNRKDKKTGQESNNDGFEDPVEQVTSLKMSVWLKQKSRNQLRMF